MTTTFTIIKTTKKTYKQNTENFKNVTPESFKTMETSPLEKKRKTDTITIKKITKKTYQENTQNFKNVTPQSTKTIQTPPKKKQKTEKQDIKMEFYSPNDTWGKLKKDLKIYNFLSTLNKLGQSLDKLPGSTNQKDFLELIAQNLGTENNKYLTTFVKELKKEELITWVKIFKDKFGGNDISFILNITDKGLNYIQRFEKVQNKKNPSQNTIIKSNLPSVVEIEEKKDAHTVENIIKPFLPSYAQFKEIDNKEKTQKAHELVNEGNTSLIKMNINNLLN